MFEERKIFLIGKHDFGDFCFNGGWQRFLDYLNTQPAWHKAKRDTAQVIGLTLSIFLPYIILSAIFSFISWNITLFMWLLLPLWVALYWFKILKPMMDKKFK